MNEPASNPSRAKTSNDWKLTPGKLPIIGTLAAIACATIALIASAAEPIDAETAARIAKAEAGPAVVDVDKYPAAIQERYKIFAKKCTQCHKLSRPINSEYALPDEWSRYVKRMMHKPDSNLDKDTAKQIYEFLSYDSSVRKKALVDEKLGKLSAEEKKTNEEKIKALHDEFDK